MTPQRDTTTRSRRGIRGAAALLALILAALGLVSCQNHVKQPTIRRAAPDSHGIFKDVAAQSGIRFLHSNGALGKFYYAEATGSGCAFLDYDNDGFQDVLLVQAGPIPRTLQNDPPRWCRLYRNNGDGTFTDVTKGSGLDRDLGYGQGVTIGDYDNDGYDDIFITGYGGNHLFHNEHGSGHFKDVTERAGVSDTDHGPQFATGAAFGDYDNDGYLDLYVCHYARWSPQTNKICKNSRGAFDYCSPDTLDPASDRLYHNNRDGTFTDVTAQSGIGSGRGRGLTAAWLDYDGDGKEDIYIANDLTQAFLWHNDGGGKFTNRSLDAGCAFDNNGNPMAAMGIGIGDYDNSGRESLFISNFSGQPNSLFRNTGNGQFLDVSIPAGVAMPHMKYLTFGCDFIDYDADGWKDIICGDGHVEIHAAESYPGTTYKERKQLFHNDGNGHFTEVTAHLGDLATPVVSRGLAVGDYDNDGRLDILVNNQNGLAQLFHNENKNGNHWISFKTVGVRSNRDGYGAKINLTAGSPKLFSEVHSSSSYASHGDSRVYFGLGRAASVRGVKIRWPSGVTDSIPALASDKSYIVTEGRGVTGRLPQSRRHPAGFRPPIS